MSLVENLEKMLEGGKDDAMLRFGLGNAYFQAANYEKAALHLGKALEFDRGYSAAWKLLGKALVQLGEFEAARRTFEDGIDQAGRKGDKQAVKEMRVFLNRLTDKRKGGG